MNPNMTGPFSLVGTGVQGETALYDEQKMLVANIRLAADGAVTLALSPAAAGEIPVSYEDGEPEPEIYWWIEGIRRMFS